MRCISIWQPFATLLVEGYKTVETRGWPAPASVIGQRIGIASTKTITPAQRAHWRDETFRRFYETLELPEPEELPRGYLLGTVELLSVEPMTEELLEEVSDEEQSYGWWSPGRYAWYCARPRKLAHPVPIRGMQGLYEWKGRLDGSEAGEGCEVGS